ncbi:MAG: hypothetical protein HY323_06035, partial [Betaproteobacteria bacterium]|nr:hypothetical protein [Betaproteobacteria bacterium]
MSTISCPLRAADAGGIDADDPAGHEADERPARVALIDRRVGLQQLGAVFRGDARDDATRARELQPPRVPERAHRVPHRGQLPAIEHRLLDVPGTGARVDLDERDVEERVDVDLRRFLELAAVKRDLDARGRARHDMRVGHDPAAPGVDQEARAQARSLAVAVERNRHGGLDLRRIPERVLENALARVRRRARRGAGEREQPQGRFQAVTWEFPVNRRLHGRYPCFASLQGSSNSATTGAWSLGRSAARGVLWLRRNISYANVSLHRKKPPEFASLQGSSNSATTGAWSLGRSAARGVLWLRRNISYANVSQHRKKPPDFASRQGSYNSASTGAWSLG